jgi:hypothetical protein
MARFIARVVSTGSSLEHIINDPGARKSILWLANRGPNNAQGRAALAYLAVAQAESDKNQKDKERTATLEAAGQQATADPFRQ